MDESPLDGLEFIEEYKNLYKECLERLNSEFLEEYPFMNDYKKGINTISSLGLYLCEEEMKNNLDPSKGVSDFFRESQFKLVNSLDKLMYKAEFYKDSISKSLKSESEFGFSMN